VDVARHRPSTRAEYGKRAPTLTQAAAYGGRATRRFSGSIAARISGRSNCAAGACGCLWDVEIPAELLDVHVGDGWVTLKGDVDFQYQSDDAFDDVASLMGVVGVTNEIRVTTR
jgi:osmotically-inducible protein OsmY